MENDFLHKIDLAALQKDTNLDLREIAALVNMKNPNAIYKWARGKDSDGTRPSFNAFVKLFEAGARVETLFGVDYATAKGNPETPPQAPLTDQQIFEAYQRALLALGKPRQ